MFEKPISAFYDFFKQFHQHFNPFYQAILVIEKCRKKTAKFGSMEFSLFKIQKNNLILPSSTYQKCLILETKNSKNGSKKAVFSKNLKFAEILIFFKSIYQGNS